MRIFYVAPASPWPASFGGSMRVAGVFSALERCGEVELAVLADDPGAEAREWLERRRATLWAAPAESATGRVRRIALGALTGRSIPASRLFGGDVLAKLREAAARADVVVLGDTYAADAIEVLDGLDCRVVVDTHNVESMLWSDIAAIARTPAERAGYRLLSRNSAALERRRLPRADSVWAASAEDAVWYRESLGLPDVHVVPNALFDCPPRLPEGEVGRIVMSGHFAYPPNEDAGLLLVEASRKLMSRGVEHRLCLVGRSPGKRLKEAARGLAHIEITGEVEDIGPWMQRAAVFAAPLRAGSGTKFKLLQAMAAGRAIVTTTTGARGLALEHDRHAWIGEAHEFAGALERLLGDRARRERLADEARRHVECHFLQPSLDAAVAAAIAGL